MKIGKIVSVEYDKFRVRLFSTTKNSTVSINGQVYYFGNIGSYLKTENSTGDKILCEVSAILDYCQDNKNYSSYNLDSSREFIVKPIGTLSADSKFSMGVGVFPSLYNDVEIVTFEDLHSILSPESDKKEHIHHTIDLGYSKNLINYKISLNINNLFNIHTAVLGNSGSGKSNTIARLLQEVLRKSKNYAYGAKIILFDVNGEYKRAFEHNAQLNKNIDVVFYKPNIDRENGYKPFFLPYHLMTLDEWLGFLMASERTQKPFWDKVLQECFKFYKIINDEERNKYINYFKWKIETLLADILKHADSDTSKMTSAKGILLKCKDIVNGALELNELGDFLDRAMNACAIKYGDNSDRMSKFLNENTVNEEDAYILDEQKLKPGEYFDYNFLKTAVEFVLLQEEAKGNLRIREFTSTMISRLDFFINNAECDFMRNVVNQNIDMKKYLSNMFGISDDCCKNQLIIIDSSEVGGDVLELMTSVVSRMLFDSRKMKIGDDRRKHPIHLVLDEAHRYIRKDVDYILKENIFEKIAREGRKYSLYLMISSQRPSELSQTVLSQCGNYIVHRIQNEVDMNYIYSVLPYFSADYINKIKQAVPGEALIFGNCVPMPLMVKIDQASPDPNSENCHIDEEWFTIPK
ncbi:ATPase [Prevotella herbatica]|uniref:ATPase n=1 Tax=Prevotella herbatica TaxID=2801997 RepID=A0ABN6EHF5_9BACT|nr:ATP-binding protein [Prevotella herbatica]BCS85365.1 ATPase [Prevotella herbatica]